MHYHAARLPVDAPRQAPRGGRTTRDRAAAFVVRTPLAMQDLEATERDRLLTRFGRRFAAGATIFQEGEASAEAFLLQEGRVRLLKRVRSSERSLGVLRPGDLLGEAALVDAGPRSSTAIALTDCAVLALDPITFGSLLAANPKVAMRIVQHLVRRLREAEEQIENAMIGDSPSRVVNTLIRLAVRTATPSAEPIVLAISPLELSSRVGLDVETVKKAVQQLRDSHYVKVVGERVVVPDLEALRRLYQLLGLKEDVRTG